MNREQEEIKAQEEVKRIERENALKVREMLRAKANGTRVENPVSSYKSYEEAKKEGDINAMMYFKTGGAERARQAEELEKVMNTDIKTVKSELSGNHTLGDMDLTGTKISPSAKLIHFIINSLKPDREGLI